MKQEGLLFRHKRQFKITTVVNPTLPVAPNHLNREFSPEKADRVYVGDITHILTLEGWLYLAVVIDLFSRQVVGWAMDKQMKTELVNDALLMAIWKRKPPKGLIWHTDQGCQYTSYHHRDLLEKFAIVQSMSRKGNCWDNAVAESFFSSLKKECIQKTIFESRALAKKTIFDYIEVFYNRQRLHSSNGYLSPIDYERKFIMN